MKRYIGRGPEQMNFHLHGAWGPAQWHKKAFLFPKYGTLQEGPDSCSLGFTGGFIT